MSIAIGPLAHLFTKQIYKFIESRCSWDGLAGIPFDIKAELEFWRHNLSAAKSFRIKTKPEITKVVFSDASADLDMAVALSRKWETSLRKVISFVNQGSTKRHLQELAIEIYKICVVNNITIYPSWIPRDQNQLADAISKSNDTDNWSIDNETYQYITSNFGIATIDRFADNQNKKCLRFNSREFCPNTSAVNAFSCNWENQELNWLCPPIAIIGKTIRHLRNCNGKGILFVPLWKSAYFWPLLTCDGKTFRPFVKHFLVLDPFFISHSRTKCVFGGFANFYSLALYNDFSTDYNKSLIETMLLSLLFNRVSIGN